MSMSRATAWKISAAIWLVTALLLLATCRGPDIKILEVDKESEPVTMTVSTSPDVGKDELYAWVSKECRDIMVLPPIQPEPVMLWQRLGKHWGRDGRFEYQFRCQRP